MKAYLFLREKNQSIPSDTLELMKDAALATLVDKNEFIGHVIDIPDWMPRLAVGRAEELMAEGKKFTAVKHLHQFAKDHVETPIKWCKEFIENRCR